MIRLLSLSCLLLTLVACSQEKTQDPSDKSPESASVEAKSKTIDTSSPVIDTSKMNILFIIDEDLTRRAVSVYGAKQVKTPNLEALAKDALVFENAFVQSPMCGPSRASFLSGIRPMNSGILTNQHLMSEKTPKHTKYFGDLIKQGGAYTVSLGKLYHGREKPKPLSAFDRLEYSKMPKDYKGVATFKGMKGGACPQQKFKYSANPKLEKELEKRKVAYDKAMETWDMANPRWWFEIGIPYNGFIMQLIGDSGKPEECDVDYKKAELAADMIKEFGKEKKQFFLSIGFDKPHVPLTAPKEYIDWYDPAKIELAEAKPENDKGTPAAAKRMGALPDLFTQWFDKEFPELAETPERQRKAVAAYYSAASFVDKQVGTLIQALKDAGTYDNTIIVFTTDHGFHLGEHGLWSKYSTYDEAIRVPFMVRVPGAAANGQRTDAIVEMMDLLPSFLDWWNLPSPDYIEGSSFAPVVEKPNREWKSAAFTTFNLEGVSQRPDITGHTVRTQQYRYTKWGDKAEFGEELYDFETDPLEQNNLILDPKFADVLADMKARLAAGWKGALPPKL